MHVIKVTGARPGEPAVRLVDEQSQPVAEVELGHCLRLEGPCECDIYLNCAKFVTTPDYAPRLRERLCLERQLAEDAENRGWAREADRHGRTIARLQALLDELGEPRGSDE